MRNKKQFNFPLFLLATANLVYALLNGFSWLTWVALVLAAIVFVWDVWEVFFNGRK